MEQEIKMKCNMDYDSEHCIEQTKTCQQCPIYWDAFDIDPEEGYEE